MKHMKAVSMVLAALFAGSWMAGCSDSTGGSSDVPDTPEGGDADEDKYAGTGREHSDHFSAWCDVAGNCGTFTDARDGRTYVWTKIGKQTWMAENLNYGEQTTETSMRSGSKWCYDDAAKSCETYGGLYTWAAATPIGAGIDESDVSLWSHLRGICPEGWRLPTDWDWEELYDALEEEGKGWSYAWNASRGGARQALARSSTGLAGQGAGYVHLDQNGYWWSAKRWFGNSLITAPAIELYATCSDKDMSYANQVYGYTAWDAELCAESATMYSSIGKNLLLTYSSNGLSVRCLKDEEVERTSIAADTTRATGWCATPGNCGTFTDERDGKIYAWTKIGVLTWMSENLDFGTKVPYTADQGDATSRQAEKWCYNDLNAHCATQGGLYQWHTALGLPASYDESSFDSAAYNARLNDSGFLRGVCPEGWHLPMTSEVEYLRARLPGHECASLDETCQTAHFLKADSTDDYAWSGRYSGAYFTSRDSLTMSAPSAGAFGSKGIAGYWWVADALDRPGDASAVDYGAFIVHTSLSFVGWSFFDVKKGARSVRCVLDYYAGIPGNSSEENGSSNSNGSPSSSSSSSGSSSSAQSGLPAAVTVFDVAKGDLGSGMMACDDSHYSDPASAEVVALHSNGNYYPCGQSLDIAHCPLGDSDGDGNSDCYYGWNDEDIVTDSSFKVGVKLMKFVNPISWGYANGGFLYILDGSTDLQSANYVDIGDSMTVKFWAEAGMPVKIYIIDKNYYEPTSHYSDVGVMKAALTGTGAWQEVTIPASTFAPYDGATNTLDASHVKAVALEYELQAASSGGDCTLCGNEIRFLEWKSLTFHR